METASAVAYSNWILATQLIPTFIYQALFFFSAIGIATKFMRKQAKHD